MKKIIFILFLFISLSNAKNIIYNDSLDDSKAFQDLINNNKVIYLQKGIIDLYKPIIITKPIKIIGNNTIIKFHLNKINKNSILFLITGKKIKRFKNKIPVINNNYIYFSCIKNTKYYIKTILNTKNWYNITPCIRYKQYYGKKLNNPLKEKFYIEKIKPLSNVILKNLIFTTNITINNDKEFINHYPQYNQTLVKLEYVINSYFENIEFENSSNHLLYLENSINNTFKKLILRNALNKDKGHGYLKISKSFYNKFYNLFVLDIRHIAIQWASAYNYFNNVYTNTDINFHGGMEHDNLFENVLFFDINTPSIHNIKIWKTNNKAHWATKTGKNNFVILKN